MAKKLLVVEDETDVKNLMLLHLQREGYACTAVENGEEALTLLQEKEYHLAILDWMLPGLSGLELCKKLKNRLPLLPILMVTARSDSTDIVLGLEMGADDYVIKPFEIPVFLARVRTLLRRLSSAQAAAGKMLQMGDLSLDCERHEVRCAGERIDLTASEFKLLAALMANPGRVLSRKKLIEEVQGAGMVVIDRVIDTHVFGLRKKLGSCGDIVETIRSIGYRVKSEC